MKLIKRIFQSVISKHKGKAGEKMVDSKLNPLFFGKVEHRQINNLVLMDENGKSHQIDHVEIRHNGIFCIETKNYTGMIYGGENQDNWTQYLYNGSKHQFVNPLKQNKSHIYHLRKVLGKNYKINSLVVMVQNNADKINVPNVINLNVLKHYLDNYNDGTNYSTDEMNTIYYTLFNASTKISNRSHIKNIKRTQSELKKGICPRCGGELVKREGKYGKFYGCSNYPKCTFVMKQ